jgi:hypothetical protein
MAARFMTSNPALAPLFVAVGAGESPCDDDGKKVSDTDEMYFLGMVGASWFGFHVLKNKCVHPQFLICPSLTTRCAAHSQEVLIARGINPTPWNNVRQDQNTKVSLFPQLLAPPLLHIAQPLVFSNLSLRITAS